MKKYPTPIIASYGEEEFFLDRDLRGLAKDPDRFVVNLSGGELKNDYELVSFIESNSADAQPRLVMVDNAGKVKPEKALKAWLAGVDVNDRSTILVLIFRDTKLPAFWDKVDKSLLTKRSHPKLKTYESDNEVIGFIEGECQKAQLRVDSRIVNGIYMGTGSDLYRVVNEIQKLKILVGSEPVTIDHLVSILTRSSGDDVWKVVDHASNKDLKKSLNSLTSLYKHSPDDPTVLLAGALMNQVDRLMVAASMLERGASSEDIAARIGMHPYRCSTFFMPFARKRSVKTLADQMQRVCQLDLAVKRSSGSSRRTLVELALVNFANS